MKSSPHVRPTDATLLSDNWGTLTRYRYELKRRDGAWQPQVREAYDRGHGAACLLHNPATDTLLLIRQFRLPAYLGDHDGFLVEVPAGLLEGADALSRMRAELEEETGFRVGALTEVFNPFTSPGSVTERIACFTGTYSEALRVSEGGGHAEEGEDIEVLHVPFAEALAMIGSGAIADAKTILLIQHMALQRLATGTANKKGDPQGPP